MPVGSYCRRSVCTAQPDETLRRTADAMGVMLPTSPADAEHICDSSTVAAATNLVEQVFRSIDGSSRLTPQQRADQFISGWLELMRQSYAPVPAD